MSDLLQTISNCDEASIKGQFLTFITGEGTFGVEIGQVMEIVMMQTITSMPEMPEYIRGLMNLRGKIIPVLDARIRFHLPIKEYDDQTCIIVLDSGNQPIGLIVDSVSDVMTIPEEDIIDTPDVNRNKPQYVKKIGRVGEQVLLLLDYETLWNEEDLEQIMA